MPRRFRKAAMLASAAASLLALPALAAPRQAERLDRGLVAAPAIDGGVLVSCASAATTPRAWPSTSIATARS